VAVTGRHGIRNQANGLEPRAHPPHESPS